VVAAEVVDREERVEPVGRAALLEVNTPMVWTTASSRLCRSRTWPAAWRTPHAAAAVHDRVVAVAGVGLAQGDDQSVFASIATCNFVE
jgi:hypothetical protein